MSTLVGISQSFEYSSRRHGSSIVTGATPVAEARIGAMDELYQGAMGNNPLR